MENQNSQRTPTRTIAICGAPPIGIGRAAFIHALNTSPGVDLEPAKQTIIVIDSGTSELQTKVLEELKTRYADKFILNIITTEQLQQMSEDAAKVNQLEDVIKLASMLDHYEAEATQELKFKQKLEESRLETKPPVVDANFIEPSKSVTVSATIKPKVVHNKKHNPHNVHTKAKFNQKFTQRRFT